MHEILAQLDEHEYVLDLGSRFGSFPASATRARVIRLDLEASGGLLNGVCGDAVRQPFRNASFAAVVANHSIEHIVGMEAALLEIGRILRPGGALYIAVPDTSTLCDRVYRWLARGGGHVNPIVDPTSFARLAATLSGAPFVAMRKLHTGFSYLHEGNNVRRSRKMLLFANGREGVLRAASLLFRHMDRLGGTRLSVYGWAFYFGGIAGAIDERPRTNVCIRCGSGHESERLKAIVEKVPFAAAVYRCPDCKTRNYFLADRS